MAFRSRSRLVQVLAFIHFAARPQDARIRLEIYLSLTE
jgi:hypothetical protein